MFLFRKTESLRINPKLLCLMIDDLMKFTEYIGVPFSTTNDTEIFLSGDEMLILEILFSFFTEQEEIIMMKIENSKKKIELLYI